MKAEVYNVNGQATGRSIELPEAIFGIEPNEHVIYLAVKQYLAGRRSGTHKTKEKSELSGSTRKLHKQKGTGGSRKGSIKNPLFRGGARIFGPRPRFYDFKLNKKVKTLAKNSAFSTKVADSAIKIVEDFSFDAPKTKEYLKFLQAFGLENKKSLLILPELNENVYLSSRNVQGAVIALADNLNTYEIMNNNSILISEKSIEALVNLQN
ncbi:MAG TPA: 50S ribosomal protein L4 [Chitinophagales bacterium]|jgi:large subunit ribosomal protein L4|nr:50S ribosomal protein L4 [Chitinophagales bacterium]HQV77937.1 50S ribosomal protein L4 [Chitinophagales bacterium]HQW78659.1 50S ribosomal protein L4 [Chitinophagales bacterium]HRB18440.1 50S ribosomal protein L4 [Chitinophagales bacterium]HRB66334.1 50S ribosomal protein L4 [Chitinophagales bacterium]